MSATNDLSIDDINDVSLAETDAPLLFVPPNEPKSNSLWTYAIIALLCFVGWTQYQKRYTPAPDDDTIIIDEDKRNSPDPNPQPTPQPVVDFKGATVYFINEKPASTASEIEVIQYGSSDSFIKSRGFKDFRWWDDDQEEAKLIVDHAVSKNIPPPFIAIIRNKDVLKIAPLPKSITDLEAFVR
jgi:hypothetical protein